MILADTVISPDTPIVVGAFVTVIGAFLAIAKLMLSSAVKERDADRLERAQLTKALQVLGNSRHDQADATRELVAETRKGNQEAKIRNGHLGDQNVRLAEMVDSVGSTVLEAVQNIGEQHITNQTIDKQIIHKEK